MGVSSEDDGLLGGLPRSRPGTRSSRRAPGGDARPVEPPEPDAPVGDGEPRDGDPVRDAVRTAARTAEAGLRVAHHVTREVIRRLPRV